MHVTGSANVSCMPIRVVTFAEHPELLETREWGEIWPEYNLHGDVMNVYWSRRYDEFPEFQYFLYDDDQRAVLAKGHSAPCVWDGTIEGLPEGIDELIAGVFDSREVPPNTLTAIAIEIPKENQGKGLSSVMVRAMAELAQRNGFTDLIAPVRPNWKERYPLAPIERYAHWTRADGLPFDPWIRVHHRVGGEILKAAPRSLLITGSVGEWAEWTGMVFPETGDYTFPSGLAPVHIDVRRDIGTYWEPNVWMRHRVNVQ
jgi:GNAT superfamily N-acetyltransferase